MKKLKSHGGLPMNLQLFADGDGGGDGGQGGDGGAGGSGGQGGQGGGGQQQPFATFPDEASFVARVKREGKTMVTDFLKGLGFDKEDDLKGIVQAYRDNEAKNKTDLEKANEAKTAAEKTAADALALVNKTLINSEAKVKALSLGVKPDRVDYALRLADLSGVTVVDSAVNAEALQAAISKVLTDMPELKGVTVPGQGGGDFSGGNGNGGALTWQLIERMSTTEAEKRMPEILEFMSKNPR